VNLSPHFTLAELARTEVRDLQRANYDGACGRLGALRSLAGLLEEVRSLLGDRPIVVHSGFRCPALNQRIGGSPSSQHLRGEAADWHVVGMGLREAFDRIRCSSLRWGQLILEDGDGDGIPTWIHLSLGAPWRAAERCQQVYEYDGREYRRLAA